MKGASAPGGVKMDHGFEMHESSYDGLSSPEQQQLPSIATPTAQFSETGTHEDLVIHEYDAPQEGTFKCRAKKRKRGKLMPGMESSPFTQTAPKLTKWQEDGDSEMAVHKPAGTKRELEAEGFANGYNQGFLASGAVAFA